MKRINKKGFTIVELVIVIAVIGVLAAVLIPTFTKLIRKSRINSDTQLIRNLNTALEADKVETEHKTMESALNAAKAYGYDISKINASATNNEILWDSQNDVFCYVNGGELEYLPDSVDADKKLKPNSFKLWKIYSAAPKAGDNYSIYVASQAAADYVNDNDVSVGVDCGDYTIQNVSYKNTGDARDVVIRTNGGTLTVDAKDDTVNHYGEATVLNIEAVDTKNCYREFGTVANAQIKKGKIVIESAEAKVENLLLVAKADKSGFEKIVVETKTGAELPTLDRTDVNIAEKGTLVLNVVTPSTDEYIYLTKAGVIEQIVITDEIKSDVSGETANVASKSASTQAVAEQVANVGTKDASGNYVDANNEIVIYADGTVAEGKDASSIATEAKADDTAVQTGLTKFSGGVGTEKSPFLISNPEEFNNINEYATGGYYFLQIDNIYLQNNEVVAEFAGTYDGNGYKLNTTADCFFGWLGGHTCFKNLVLDYTDNLPTFLWGADWNTAYGVEFNNVIINGSKTYNVNGTNFGLLIRNALYTSSSGVVEYKFKDITTNVNFQNAGTCTGVIIGSGPCFKTNAELVYENCINNGNVVGSNNVGFLYGNPTYIETLNGTTKKMTIINCQQNGILNSTSNSGTAEFALGNTEYITNINNTYKSQGTGSYIVGNYLDGKVLSICQNGNTFAVMSDDSSVTYKISVGINSLYFNANGNVWTESDTEKIPNYTNYQNIQISNNKKYIFSAETVSQGTAMTNTWHAYTVNVAVQRGVISSEFNSFDENGFALVVKDGVNYVIYDDYAGYADSNVEISVLAYSGDKLVGQLIIN